MTIVKAAIYNPDAKDSSFLTVGEVDNLKLTEKNGAIAKVRGVGVCGSDLLKLNRNLVKPGTILGHELVAEIEEISKEMSEKYQLQKGDRIISSHHVPCLQCEYCINGKESLCQQFKSTNFYPGAFCDYLALSENHLKYTVQKIPNSLSDEEASFTEPIACCIKAIKKSGILNYKGKARVLIIGLGSIGQILGQLIKLNLNEVTLIGCDLLQSKLDLAISNDFDIAMPKIDSEEADYIFLAGGANATIDLASQNIKNGGTIVVFSSIPDSNIGFRNNDIYYKELSIVSSYSPNLEDLKESLDLLINKKISVKNLISHRANLEGLGKTIKQCQDENGIKVFLDLL